MSLCMLCPSLQLCVLQDYNRQEADRYLRSATQHLDVGQSRHPRWPDRLEAGSEPEALIAPNLCLRPEAWGLGRAGHSPCTTRWRIDCTLPPASEELCESVPSTSCKILHSRLRVASAMRCTK
jgi:hypothetical protein